MRPDRSQSPRRRPAVTLALALPLVAICLLAGCQGRLGGYSETPFKPDPEAPTPKSVTPGPKWTEGDYSLPAWPRDDDLVEVKLDGPAQRLTHYIDTRSLQTGSDGVVRYTLVTESASGARNVSFEGLRCTPNGRWTSYAYGTDGRFRASGEQSTWIRVSEGGGDRLHYELWRHYLCTHLAFEPRPRTDQLRMLASGRVPGVDNAGFLPD